MATPRRRTLNLSLASLSSPRVMRTEINTALRNLDRCKEVTQPSIFDNNASRPPAQDNGGRVIFVRQTGGTLQGQYSDGAAWQVFLVGTLSFATPTIGFGTAYAQGAATTVIRSDATLKYPAALMSAANAATAMFTDNAVDTTLTSSLGNFIFVAGGSGGLIFDVDPVSASAVSAIVRIRPGSSNFTGLQTSYFGGNVSTTMRAWDANMSAFAGVLTGATIVGYDSSTFSVTPSGGSSGTNNLYCMRLTSPIITNTNATWGEAACAYFKGVRRSISTPTITTQAGVIIEPPTAATSDQIAILIRNATSEQAVATTNRIALDILASNSTAPNVYSLRTGNFVDLSSASAKQRTVLNLHQLATGAVAGAHVNLDDKAGDPPAPNTGDIWRSGDSLWFRQAAANVDLTLGGAGSPGPAGPAGPMGMSGEDGLDGDIGPMGPAGAAGTAGITGAQGPMGPAVFLSAESIEGEMGVPGVTGATGATGSTGAQGPMGPAVFLAAESIEGEMGPPGIAGAAGAAGSAGAMGPAGPAIFLVAESGEDGMMGPPGATGPQGPAGGGGGGLTLTAFEKDLGAGDRSGTFDITGLSGLTPDKPVLIMQTAAPIASKGNARDEAEMDYIDATGYVVDANTIRAYWHAPSVVVGTYAFGYVVSG